MKRILFALFIVLASSSVTDADESNEAAIEEMISAAQTLKEKGQGTWNFSSLSIKNEQHSTSIFIYFKKGLRNLMKNKCKSTPECKKTIRILIRNLPTLKTNEIKSSPEWKIKERNFTQFMDDLVTFLQKYRRS